MALIKCPECGKEISDLAKSCPNCGFPIEGEFNSENYLKNNNIDAKILDAHVATEGVRHIHEYICTCLNCGNTFSYNNDDISKDKEGRWNDLASTFSAIGGSKIEKSIFYNHQKQSYNADFNKCPKCGSKKISKKYTNYYINSNGEYLDGYQPSIADKTTEGIGNFFGKLGDVTYSGCLIVAIIPFILILYAIFQFIKAIFILF